MDRDFDIEKVIDKMREFRDRRDLELLKEDFSNINLDTDYKKELPKNQVLNIKYLGSIDWEDSSNGEKSQKDIYLIIEQMENAEGKLVKIEKYYTEDYELLGGNNKGDLRDFILLKEKYAKDNELLEKLNSLDKSGILDLNEIEQERIEELASILGIAPKDIEKIAELDKEEIEEAEEKIEKEEKTVTKKELEKISSKQEIDISQKVTDNETMASLLNVQDKGYKKLAVIYSDKMKGVNNTEFSIVGIKDDGTAEVIDSLEQRYGINPTKEINSLNYDGSELKTKQAESIFSVKGENEKQIAVRIGAMGTIETDLVRTPRQANQEAISIPIENQSIRPTTRETREFMNQQRNPDIIEEIERVKSHEKVGCKEATIKDINDNPNDDTHTHIEIDETYIKKCVKEILKDDIIASNYGRDYVRDKIINKIEKKEYLSKDEVLQEVREDLRGTAEDEHESISHSRQK